MAGDVQRVQSYESEDMEAENSGVRQRISPDGRDEAVSEPGLSNLKLALLPVVTAGVGFGWALQLELLTPYIQTLGVEHEFSSFVWLCGPIAGLVVQPIVGLWTDRCTSKWGRRRPYIFSGVLLIMLAVTVIGFGADIGSLLGDAKEISCQVFRGKRSRAASVVILGFWLLDIAANTVDPPLRALLADLSGSDQQRVVAANAVYTLWGALGSVLGYSAGSYGHWHKLFPSLLTKSCCAPCANLKAAFLLQIALLLITASITLVVAKETPLSIDGQSPATKQTVSHRNLVRPNLTIILSTLARLLTQWYSINAV